VDFTVSAHVVSVNESCGFGCADVGVDSLETVNGFLNGSIKSRSKVHLLPKFREVGPAYLVGAHVGVQLHKMKLTISVDVVMTEFFADGRIRCGGCAENGFGDPFGEFNDSIFASNGFELFLVALLVAVLVFSLLPGDAAT